MTMTPAGPAEVQERLMEGDHTEETHQIGQGVVMAVSKRSQNGAFYTVLTRETGWYVVGHQEVDGRTQVYLTPLPDGFRGGEA